MALSRFNVRVYGIWVDGQDRVLVSDEYFHGMYITKFPGGGLEPGEGTVDGLKREWREELGVEIEVLAHFYTTDFFQQSAFHADAQIISIYYLVTPETDPDVPLTGKPYDFLELKEGVEAFRKIPLQDLAVSDVTFPIDKKVVEMLKNTGFTR